MNQQNRLNQKNNLNPKAGTNQKSLNRFGTKNAANQSGKALKNNLILCGFMGSGKSTVGRLLAAHGVQASGYELTAIHRETRPAKPLPKFLTPGGRAPFGRWSERLPAAFAAKAGWFFPAGAARC